MNKKRIGLKEVRLLEPGELVWDGAVAGFGARRQKGAAVAYVMKYRTVEGRQRWYTIGRHGAPWTPETARDEARRILGEVVGGKDPATHKAEKRNALTIAEVCALYLSDAEAGRLLTRNKTPKKASTLATDRGRIQRHILPLLGTISVAAVTRRDIEVFLHSVAEGKTAGTSKTDKKRGLARVTGGRGTASRTLGLLGAVFSYAQRMGLRADNPVHGVVRFADGRRDRRLSEEEFAALGQALRSATDIGVWPPAVAATRFLALTGWRSGEALGLRWGEVDIGRRIVTLPDSKTGRSVRPLSLAAAKMLSELPRVEDLVFPASRGNGRMGGYTKFWARIARIEGLPADVTPHILRHTFASIASDLGYSELTIGALLGHKNRSVTARYVHSTDTVLLAAADAVANRISELMGDRSYPGVLLPFEKPIRTAG